jgi:hypothetical protein
MAALHAAVAGRPPYRRKECCFPDSFFRGSGVYIISFTTNAPKYATLFGVGRRKRIMPAVMEAIDRMTSDERVKTMEYLWAAMTAVAAPEPPAWHGDVLAERRRRVQSGEEEFITIAESKRRLREAVNAC